MAEKSSHVLSSALLSEIMGMVSHEINNPLSVVRLISERLAQDKSQLSAEELKSYSDQLEKNTDKVARLFRCLRGLAHQQTQAKLEMVNLFQIISDCLFLFQKKLASRNIFVSLEIPPQLELHTQSDLILKGIAIYLSEFLNIPAQHQPFTIKISSRQASDLIAIDFTCKNFQPSDQLGSTLSQLFSPEIGRAQHTTKEGLSICSLILLKQSEHITEVSTEKQSTAKGKILYVEDSEETWTLIKYAFESTEIDIDFTGSSAEALKLFVKNPYLAVVADYNLSDGNSLELLQQIRSQNPNIPFIFVSGDTTLNKDNLTTLGATDFFLKPFKMSEFKKYLFAKIK